MKLREKVERFRSASEPVSGLWQFGSNSAYGSLTWLKGIPTLTIIFEIAQSENIEIHPIYKYAKPPNRSKIFGYSPPFGCVTLTDCLQCNFRTNHNFDRQVDTISISFMPSRVWIGADTDNVLNKVTHAVLSDNRLGGFFGETGLQIHDSFSEEFRSVAPLLGKPAAIWSLQSREISPFTFGKTGFEVKLDSDLTESFSATMGHSVNSRLRFVVAKRASSPVAEFIDVSFKLEQLLSVFSLERFEFDTCEFYAANDPIGVAIVWQLGTKATEFKPPMNHQILVNFSKDENLRALLDGWFNSNETIGLSRWLFHRALAEKDDGIARFILVCQAFETLGREIIDTDKKPITTSKLRDAIKRLKVAWMDHVPVDFIDRSVGLIQSSNRRSFRNTLQDMILKAADHAKLNSVPLELNEFCKRVADTRNTLTHMSENSEGGLNEAFSKAHKLSLLLCFWYAVYQAKLIGAIVPDAGSFLTNNRNARHGLPNDWLEKY
jgi:ApeA N-terminal domain 1